MSFEGEALAIVEAALDIEDSAARAAFVAERCGGDAALQARVEQLLALDTADFKLLPTESFARPLGVVDLIPPRIGPWRVTREIARGGMGAVVMAERDDGVFNQVVAIKLIRGDLASDRAKARFAEERRILARLRHPDIVRILDGGDADGRPWLAMDYVDGEAVTHALDRRGAALPERLAAFEAVCEAVAFAHRSLVIHADIKPSNVLMSKDGAVHLLDFGIARLIVDLDVEETGDPYPLTKGYAAPERGVGVAPTIASDVFSLGVLLLAMLGKATPEGNLPFVAGTRLPAGQLDGDLAAIAAKALAEDPAARYPDVAALIADLVRMREHRPVAARAHPARTYLISRFVQRHRRGLALTGVAALVLIGATVFSTVSYVRAERARIEADRRFVELRGLARFMLFELSDRLDDAPGSVMARARLAEVASRYLDRLRAASGAPVDLRLDTARGYRRLASILGLSGTASLGRPVEAAKALDAAQAILDGLARERPNDAGVIEERGWVAETRWVLAGAGGPAISDRAAALFDRALAIDPTARGARLGRIMVDRDRGFDLVANDRPGVALPLLRAALKRLRALPPAPEWRRRDRLVEIGILAKIGDATYYLGDKPGALAPYREADAIVRAELARAPSARWTEKLGETAFDISSTLGEIGGRDAEALAIADAALSDLQKVLAFGPDAGIEIRVAVLQGQRSLLLDALGRTPEAMAASRAGILVREARLARVPGDPNRQRDVAVALANHAAVLAKGGARQEACATARRGRDLWLGLRASGELNARDARTELAPMEAAIVVNCGPR
ncbi:serine/threonine-protein kinase [Sphingomonas immobilis]|uniref:Serine/threonine-protein kinase n=1 Tax=Sphingomonas immobilis TaxID=3063997 RepID=A0ABT8ZTZ4_9SPHN|nr:serine/threonine-protein kinase [Sphingomonas sp. CA1-15]MDO7840738.1 serine/threonine-protein kinase [Sphingomonas sp. CA1-15]